MNWDCQLWVAMAHVERLGQAPGGLVRSGSYLM
jgi:hypothetical protein